MILKLVIQLRMMNAQSIEVWMIAISHSETSQLYVKECAPSWKNYNLKSFEAITPKSLKHLNELHFYKKRSGREFTETEKAVWYSHFLLWKKCWEEKKPLIIIEHDSILRKDIGEVGRTKLLSFLRDRKQFKSDPVENNNILSPGSGYVIFPDDIINLITFARNNPIDSNSDGYIREYVETKYGWPKDFSYIEQIKINNLTTINHGKMNSNIMEPE